MKAYLSIILAIGLAGILTGCTSVSFFVANFPTYFQGVKVYKDVVFDQAHQLALDIYLPPKDSKINHKVIVFFYGGSWESGDKADYKFVGTALAKLGYMVAIPNYRQFPEVKFPDFMVDAANSVLWVNQNISNYVAGQKEIVIMGHSAGANIATLLITDKKYLKDDVKISAGIGLAGAYNFVPNTDNLKMIFGPPEKYPLMRPVTFVDGTEPPLFLGHGAKDKVVAHFNFDNMVEALTRHKSCVVTKEYPNFDHVDMIANLSWVGGKDSVVLKDVSQFLAGIDNGRSCE